MGRNTVEGWSSSVNRLHRSFCLLRAEYDAVLVGTHNESQVDRWPLIGALCRELRSA